MRRTFTRLFVLLSIVVMIPVAAHAQPIHVKADAGSGGNGGSWATAFQYLQDALAVADAGDEVWVAAGTYYPDQDEGCPLCEDDQTQSFAPDGNVTVLGGFAGTELDKQDRDHITNVTILSGDLLQDDGPGRFENNADNSHHVVLAFKEMASSSTALGSPPGIRMAVYSSAAGEVTFNNPAPRWLDARSSPMTHGPLVEDSKLSSTRQSQWSIACSNGTVAERVEVHATRSQAPDYY